MSSEMSISFSYTKALSGPSIRNTSSDYQSLPLPLSICKFSQTIFYPLLFYVGRHVLLRVAGDNNTIHAQVTYLLEGNSLLKELSSVQSPLLDTFQSFEFLYHRNDLLIHIDV